MIESTEEQNHRWTGIQSVRRAGSELWQFVNISICLDCGIVRIQEFVSTGDLEHLQRVRYYGKGMWNNEKEPRCE